MRLRRRADKVRSVGWLNLAFAAIWSVIALDITTMAVGGLWAAIVMAVAYGIAWVIDKRAERVVTR